MNSTNADSLLVTGVRVLAKLNSLWIRGSWVLCTNVGSKLFVTLGFVILRAYNIEAVKNREFAVSPSQPFVEQTMQCRLTQKFGFGIFAPKL
jgi:hypothetical protein